MSLKELVEDDPLLPINSAIDRLRTVNQTVTKAGATFAMADSEEKETVLICRSGKYLGASAETLAKMKACNTSVEEALSIAASAQTGTDIDLTLVPRHGRKAE